MRIPSKYASDGTMLPKDYKYPVGPAMRAHKALIAGFLEEDCTVDPLLAVPAERLYKAFRDWMVRKGMPPISHVQFGRVLARAHFADGLQFPVSRISVDGKQVRHYLGLDVTY